MVRLISTESHSRHVREEGGKRRPATGSENRASRIPQGGDVGAEGGGLEETRNEMGGVKAPKERARAGRRTKVVFPGMRHYP